MNAYQRVLVLNSENGFYKIKKYPVGDFFGPVDLGLHRSAKNDSLNIGVGLLAGSIFPGSNRLIFSGKSPCWSSFYISSMGGAGLVFENLGINMLSIIEKAHQPSVIYLNRNHGEEIDVEIHKIKIDKIWNEGRGGIYSLMDYMLKTFGHRYENDPRILAVGPGAGASDIGAICSVPVKKGELTYVDTWAGRGGLGSKLFQEHGIAAIIYGGTFIDDDFRDRKVADQWFEEKYQKKLAAKDIEATAKYRFEEKFKTGGTFGVNYTTLKGNMLSFNYKSMYWTEEERLKVHEDLVLNHYLKQFNEETIEKKQMKNCGEPCVAVCKKMNGKFKKDYEPYQTMGPLCGIFDMRAAEKINHHADTLGFDGISVGGFLAWLMENLSEGLISPEELGVDQKPIFSPENFRVVEDSMHNADIGIQLLDRIVDGTIDLSGGARKYSRHLSREKGRAVLDSFVYTANARKGWMVPNQYWTPGVLSPMAIMGKYYMHYKGEFKQPRELGRIDANRFKKELILDNMGLCRFHRGWAEEMIPEIIESLYGMSEKYLKQIAITATRINSRNASIFWESERNIDYVYTFLKKKKDIEKVEDESLDYWIDFFEKDKKEAALSFWYEIHKGITESLKEF